MGGHGGLNILPQKKWNVYNYDNRDIVEKDKKQHAQKMKKKYESDRINTLQKKFDVLRGQTSQFQQKQREIRQQLKNDSVLNHQFKRLVQQKRHVNLFQKEQKIIENRELLECQKLKEAEFLKGKQLDYSSKFLGTYNDDSKIPWYAKSKSTQKQTIKIGNKPLRNQRYDLQDLTDQIRIQKIKNRQYNKDSYEKIKMCFGGQQQIEKNRNNLKQKQIKTQPHSDRQRSRNKKHQFLKNRQEFLLKNIGGPKQNSSEEEIRERRDHDFETKLQNQVSQAQKSPEQQEQLYKLRIKRLKRQQKQRKRAQQLKIKLMESINKN